ncbi:hypothetical protein [Yoonia sp. MH D7]
MKTAGIALIGMMALQACSPPVPASNAGPGFNDYAEYELQRARREAAVTGAGTSGTFTAPAAVQTSPVQTSPAQASTTFSAPAPVQTGGIGAADLAAAGIGASSLSAAPQDTASGAPMTAMTNVVSPAADGFREGIQATPGNAAPALQSNVGISDEQDFKAVASRETIESDAQRRAAQAANREQVQVIAVPERSGTTGPNIVEYALNAPNVKGQEYYSRSVFSGSGRFERNCVKYGSPDAAQRDFLASGGPERDRKGIDPDGDGFACGWDPAPFKQVAGN